jgi:hypothetical protein
MWPVQTQYLKGIVFVEMSCFPYVLHQNPWAHSLRQEKGNPWTPDRGRYTDPPCTLAGGQTPQQLDVEQQQDKRLTATTQDQTHRRIWQCVYTFNTNNSALPPFFNYRLQSHFRLLRSSLRSAHHAVSRSPALSTSQGQVSLTKALPNLPCTDRSMKTRPGLYACTTTSARTDPPPGACYPSKS